MHDDSPTYTSRSTPEDDESPSDGGAIFSGSHHFTVTGGTFTSINNRSVAPSKPSDFRTISLGDIYLHEELALDQGSCIIRRLCTRPSARRVYSAKIHGRKANATVAIYQGDRAEEEWWEDVERYSWLRHPNFVQLHGVTTTPRIHAAIFHDDLIPFRHFLTLYRHSPVLTVYIYGYCQTEFMMADEYLVSTFRRPLLFDECTLWVRRSTGQLCADLIPSNGDYWPYGLAEVSRRDGIDTSDASRQETIVVDYLTLEQYHSICYWDLSRHLRISISAPITVTLGAVVARTPDGPPEGLVEIASFSDVESDWDDWSGAEGEIMDNGWTRFNSADVPGCTLRLYVEYEPNSGAWPSQANHIFSGHGITSGFENYAVVYEVRFEIIISDTLEDLASSYLFLCPPHHLQIARSSFRWPDYPVYWSLDSSGSGRLTAEEATQYGFPSIQLITEVHGDFWDACVYMGLRQFHHGKGFDPDSPEVARHLGFPLYQISGEAEAAFADDEDHHLTEPGQPHEIALVSKTYELTMYLQLGLMLFLTLYWLYQCVC